jgi:hypothetical protein
VTLNPFGSSDGSWYRHVTERSTGSICDTLRHSCTFPLGVHAHLELGAEHVPEVFSHGSQAGVPDAGDFSHLVLPRRALLRAFVRGFVSLGAFLGGFFVRSIRGFIRGFALAFVFLLRGFTLARALAFLRLVEPGAIGLAHRHHDG